MPINYQQIQAQADQFCDRALKHRQALNRAAIVLMDALTRYGTHPTELQQLIEKEAQTNKSLRCAIPYQEHISTAYKLPVAFEPIIANRRRWFPDQSQPASAG